MVPIFRARNLESTSTWRASSITWLAAYHFWSILSQTLTSWPQSWSAACSPCSSCESRKASSSKAAAFWVASSLPARAQAWPSSDACGFSTHSSFVTGMSHSMSVSAFHWLTLPFS